MVFIFTAPWMNLGIQVDSCILDFSSLFLESELVPSNNNSFYVYLALLLLNLQILEQHKKVELRLRWFLKPLCQLKVLKIHLIYGFLKNDWINLLVIIFIRSWSSYSEFCWFYVWSNVLVVIVLGISCVSVVQLLGFGKFTGAKWKWPCNLFR